MITEEQIDLLVERLISRIEKANTYFLKNIGASIKAIRDLTPSQAQQLVQILKYGGGYEQIVEEISKMTDMNIKDIESIFSAYAKKDQLFYKEFYAYRNKPFIPFEENAVLQSQKKIFTNMIRNEMYNYTRNNVLGYTIRDILPNGKKGRVVFRGLKETYNRVLDEALLNVGQGKETFDSAMSSIMKEIGGSGLKTVEYESGRSVRLDSVVRMHLKGRLAEYHNEAQQIFGEQFEADGVEITVHANPAPDHEYAQGRRFSNEEYQKLQLYGIAKDYKDKTVDLHSVLKSGEITTSFRPISEMNCYHYVYSVILEVGKPRYTDEELQKIIDDNNKGFDFEGEHYTMYEGTQLQRQLERKIREQKDIQVLGKSSNNEGLITSSQRNINMLTQKYKELSDASGLPTKLERLNVNGYRKVKM